MTEYNPEVRNSRTVGLTGEDAFELIRSASVLVFGLGGVGSYVCEGLARAGVGRLGLVDSDVVSESNINRQLVADYETLGRLKVDVEEERIRKVTPDCKVDKYNLFYLPDSEEAKQIDFSKYDYVVDAIDTVSAKLDIIQRAKEAEVKVISSMGTGNKLDNTRFEVCDISKTSVCPLAKVMRKELRNRGIKDVKVVYSKEESVKCMEDGGKRVPASISFVPSVAGLIIAGEIIKDIMGNEE
mgnify:CR=1 FL=1